MVSEDYSKARNVKSVDAAGPSERKLKEHWSNLAPIRHIAMAYAMATQPAPTKPLINLRELFKAAEEAEKSLPDVKYKQTRHSGAVLELDNALKVRVFNPDEQFETMVAQLE